MLRARRAALSAVLALLALSIARAPAGAEGLPPPLRDWLGCEQGRLSRSVDTSRLTALTNHQDPRFAPERGATFAVKSYWVDASRMDTFKGLGLSGDLRQLFVRKQGGAEQVRLLVHPESEGLYREFLQGATQAEDFQATATASSRTLMVWPTGQPQRAFFGKVSLDKEIGGVRRTISQGEVARSVGVNNVLQLARRRGELPASFKFVPEVFSTIPHGMGEGGMVIRAIPSEVTSGRVRYVPLFSLYAEPAGGGKPLLAEMIDRSGQSPEAFVRDKIIRPFAQQYLQLAVGKGIVPEPHAQNLLIEVGRDGQPTGNLVHRDFGGFNIDFDHRRQSGLALPGRMPTINGLEQDYKLGRFGTPAQVLGRNMDVFFYGGFVYNLDKELPAWGRRGYLAAGGSAPRQGAFKEMLVRELEQQYRAMTGQRVNLRGDLRRVSEMIAGRNALAGGPGVARTRIVDAPGRWSRWRAGLGRLLGGQRALQR